MTQGQKPSILSAQANFIAQALPDVANKGDEGWTGLSGWADDPDASMVRSNDGDKIGDEKERRLKRNEEQFIESTKCE